MGRSEIVSVFTTDCCCSYNSHIAVPHGLREERLDRIHEGHQGIEHRQKRINPSVWWPGVSQWDNVQKEHPITTYHSFTRLQLTSMDLFELSEEHFLLVVDYFSRHPQIAKVASTTSIWRFYIVTMAHSMLPRAISKSYGFQHTASSPRHSQSDGQGERTVKL